MPQAFYIVFHQGCPGNNVYRNRTQLSYDNLDPNISGYLNKRQLSYGNLDLNISGCLSRTQLSYENLVLLRPTFNLTRLIYYHVTAILKLCICLLRVWGGCFKVTMQKRVAEKFRWCRCGAERGVPHARTWE